MPRARTCPAKRADKTPASKSELRANLQGLGARESRSDTGASNDRIHVEPSYGRAAAPPRSIVLASRRELVLGASGFVLVTMYVPLASSDPSGQEPWGDGTFWSDGLGWVA